MINISVTMNSISVTGHAITGAPAGQNIVCAGVSALTATLIYGLKDVAETDIEFHADSGDVAIRWQHLSDIGKSLIDTWFLGICGIKNNYGHIAFV